MIAGHVNWTALWVFVFFFALVVVTTTSPRIFAIWMARVLTTTATAWIRTRLTKKNPTV